MFISKGNIEKAINDALFELVKIRELNDGKTTCGSIPCISFAGAVLEYATKATGKTYKQIEISLEKLNGGEFSDYKDGDLANILLKYCDNQYTHAFCVYFDSDSDSVFIIQTYLGKTVDISRKLARERFYELWKAYVDLKGSDGKIFEDLFSVRVDSLVNISGLIITKVEY
ncbi:MULTISPECIES: hypothetical protein [Enterobacterales]|uniref:hypothetical protein n=1 Tax=Enterobacterales TaxID=91347 RepID=UPI002EDA0F4C